MWGWSPPPKMGGLGAKPPSLEITHFVTGSVMFFVVFPTFRHLFTPPKTPSFPTGPTSSLGVLRVSPHMLLILEHKIMCFGNTFTLAFTCNLPPTMLSKPTNYSLDGVRKLSEEYTTTTFFTILTNKTLPNLPSEAPRRPAPGPPL